MKKKKEITIEDLAGMMARGFNEVNEGMERKFQAVDKRFIELEEKMDKKFQAVDERFDKLENKLEALKAEVEHRRVHVFDHKDLEHRVEKLENNYKKFFLKTAKGNA